MAMAKGEGWVGTEGFVRVYFQARQTCMHGRIGLFHAKDDRTISKLVGVAMNINARPPTLMPVGLLYS